jgi:alpha-N-acetylglucosaminidase
MTIKKDRLVNPMRVRIMFFCTLFLVAFGLQAKTQSYGSVDPSTAIVAATGVISRMLPGRAGEFRVEMIPAENGLDVFELESRDGKIVLRGSSVTAVSAGLNWYLKYYCNAHVSWTGDQLRLPDTLPAITKKVRIVTPYKYRYIYNYCTFNYTMSFWGWKEWERELDFLALNGVNLALAVVGQEAVWQNVMRRMGMSKKEISDFIPGPAYQAWWLMGNIEGWGGPVSQAWIDSRVELQKKILARMRELGIEPVLQGFYGMAPRAMIADFPGARIYETGLWSDFNRPAIIDPTDPFFDKVAAVWYDEQRKLFGDAEFFGGDPFHEGGGANINLTDAARGIQRAMLAARPDSVWVLQAWQSNPRKELLDGTVKENTLLLDLFAETNPQWNRRDGFYGHPWVWNIISNFGGNTSLYGSLWKVAEHPVQALKDPKHGNLAGIGAMMEASMMDAVLWDLLFEMGWRTESPDLDTWIAQYAARRYGSATPGVTEAWKILKDTAYAAKVGGGEPESPLCARPGFDLTRVWGTLVREYDPCVFVRSWELLVDDSEKYRGVGTYGHDLVDVSRQALSNLAVDYMNQMSQAFKKRDKAKFEKVSAAYLELILDQDRLLATDSDFMLGKWIEDARALGGTDAEKDLFEWNARTLITVWGPRAPSMSLHEYAYREWSGLLGSLYYMRWKLFIDDVTKNFDAYAKGKKTTGKGEWDSFIGKVTHEHTTGIDPTGIDWFAVEEQWTHGKEKYPSAPLGDPITEARRVYDKYFPEISASCKLK